ncbi:ICP22 family protein [Jannaschia marina]|uniref:hypothetical protein n=1 Tax=Jannaschia marina TaxID=2741674 RepID=UPI0015C8E972|nr:hypothetical protein [Jannaschia marina]
MRILSVALLTIMLIALLRFTFIQPDVQSLLGLRDDTGRTTYDLVSNLPPDACVGSGEGTEHTFIVRESDVWTALAGSPGYASASFNMPKEVGVVSGVLILDVRAELQAGSTGRLRVNVNGQRRGEIILGEGVNENTIRLNLLPSDLTQSQLTVSLAAFGAFPQLVCRQEWDGGLIVRIDPTSRVELTTDGPLVDLNDRLRSTGTPYQIAWPAVPEDDNHERMIGFAVDQRLRDIRTEFLPDVETICPTSVVFSPEDLLAADEITAGGQGSFEDPAWPLMIAQTGQNSEARFFEYETAWRHSYDLRETPDAEYPTALSLGLRAVGLQEDAEWLLTVTLNGGLVYSEKFEGETLDLARRINLPYGLHRFSNALEIRLISSERQDARQCTRGSPITAQLKRTTALNGGVPAPDQTIGEFINALSGTLHLEVSDEMNAAEASSAVAFLADTFGERVQWTTGAEFDPEGATVIVALRPELESGFAALTETYPDHLYWLVWPRLPEDGGLPYRPVHLTDEALNTFLLDEGPRIAALVAVPHTEVPPTSAAAPFEQTQEERENKAVAPPDAEGEGSISEGESGGGAPEASLPPPDVAPETGAGPDAETVETEAATSPSVAPGAAEPGEETPSPGSTPDGPTNGAVPENASTALTVDDVEVPDGAEAPAIEAATPSEDAIPEEEEATEPAATEAEDPTDDATLPPPGPDEAASPDVAVEDAGEATGSE